jgi:multidrug efflux pump subunit AcrA (membrane-fusion protein)
LTWWIVDVDTSLSFLALVIMTTSGIKTLFNLNPLIKLDGYYLLSDYLEIPNLRQKSFTYLKALAKSLQNFSIKPSVNADARERRIYLGYGILATVYSSWLMTIIAVRLGSFLVDRYQGAGFVLFGSLVMLTFQRSWRAGLARARTIVRWRPYTLWRPGWTRWVSLAALAAALFVIRVELKVSGEFTIMPGHNADIRSPVAGIIEEVYVNEGDHVVAGARIVRLADSEHRVELRQIESEIVEKRARLKLLRAGAMPQEVDLSRQQLETARTHQRHLDKQYEEARRLHGTRQAKADAAVKTAETRLEYGQKDLGRSRDLFKAGILSRTQLDQSEEQVRLRQEELESARAELAMVLADDLAQLGGELAAGGNAVAEADGRLRVLLAGSRPEAIEAMAAEIARLEARRLYLVEQVRLATVVTPAAGVVVTPKLDQKRGEHVTHGDLIAEVFELEHVLPEIIVS